MSPPSLPMSRYRLRFTAEQPVALPPPAGAIWRGAFGHALKRLVCVTREPRCPDCLLYRSCLYPYLFETPPDPEAGKLRKYPAAPHPYVLRPVPGPERMAAGEALGLDLTLFGRAVQSLPYVIHALSQAGERGIGPGRGRVVLQRVSQAHGDAWVLIHRAGGALNPLPPPGIELPPCPAEITLHLETPLRLVRDGRTVGPGALDFAGLFGALLRRISLLTTFHTETPLDVDFAGLSRAARAVRRVGAELCWADAERFSRRQGRAVPLGGVTGWVRFAGDLAPFWPYLWLGQWVQVGKGTVMGLGAYRLAIPQACESGPLDHGALSSPLKQSE